jgi:DNA-binding FadR family transcriptional regulator
MWTMTTFRSFLTTALMLGFAFSAARAADDPLVLLPQYEQVWSALAADDLPAAKDAAQKLATSATGLHQPGLAGAARAVAGANDLAAAREAFKALSTRAIALAHDAKGYFVATCSMPQADWLQPTREIRNPYLGKTMPSCGEIKD